MKWLCLLIIVVLPQSGLAFTSWQTEDSSGEVKGLLRLYGSAQENPEEDFYYKQKETSSLGNFARLIADGQSGEHVRYQLNLLQSYIPSSSFINKNGMNPERSASLTWSFSEEDYSQLDVDQLNLHLTVQHVDIILGRQPINLATTLYFTPNDFFAPFSAQTFYQAYKPGVDAVRVKAGLGELAQLSFIGVFGYSYNPLSDTNWSRSPDSQRNSYLIRGSTVLNDMEWVLMAGRVRTNNIIGASIQGEWFDWLGIRAEGHVAYPQDDNAEDYTEFVLGLEHQWENRFKVLLEFFYHGMGADSVSKYSLSSTPLDSQYLARRYSALGLSYEFTPLLQGESVLLTNHIDHSQYLALNLLYSLSDESELGFNLNLPQGEPPQGAELKSEFGFYPAAFNIELRSYF